ncbi:MAG: hypothetical protein M1821_004561 [Bathelium mastoideum]|nr:MAG: hypothetical protein M1821_004561 [Bathelium mastoideum]
MLKLLFLFVFQFHNVFASEGDNYLAWARSTAEALQVQSYDKTSGLYDKTWWNSANGVTAIADLAALSPSFLDTAKTIIETTFANAPTHSKYNQHGTWLDGFYDDEGWWALAWIQAYDVTQNETYLRTAETIFDDMTTGWPTVCGAGLWWDKKKSYISSISNELFLSVAAHLANRVSSKRSHYIDWAQKEWQWFQRVGVIDKQGLIHDGVNKRTCKSNHRTTFTYNQGVILGGLVELERATGDQSLIMAAQRIADAVLTSKKLIQGGILIEPGQNKKPNQPTSISQFKGIYMRNLQRLQRRAPKDVYQFFIMWNAESAWKKAREKDTNLISSYWLEPFNSKGANLGSQVSGLDLFNAAASVSQIQTMTR